MPSWLASSRRRGRRCGSRETVGAPPRLSHDDSDPVRFWVGFGSHRSALVRLSVTSRSLVSRQSAFVGCRSSAVRLLFTCARLWFISVIRRQYAIVFESECRIGWAPANGSPPPRLHARDLNCLTGRQSTSCGPTTRKWIATSSVCRRRRARACVDPWRPSICWGCSWTTSSRSATSGWPSNRSGGRPRIGSGLSTSRSAMRRGRGRQVWRAGVNEATARRFCNLGCTQRNWLARRLGTSSFGELGERQDSIQAGAPPAPARSLSCPTIRPMAGLGALSISRPPRR